MAAIIKKQILKHLSRFTKNLSPDKINLSTLKGQGQLTNLELDEEVLQNVLELPTWLAITRVYCNKASIRIQWTKLKTHPICLYLDKVEVEMRTCEEPRPPNGQSPIALAAGQSEYGFAEKVVEGMFIVVNSITIKIHSKAFHASFELWQLQGYSVNPNWQQSDLRLTRITDPQRGEVLTFKELTWQTLRIEADATDNGDQDPVTTPLRLITNQGRIQISLKRRTKDCNVMASKLMFLLDDLLWVLTDSQLKAMMKYAESLSEAMEKSAQQRKSLAPESVQITPPAPSTQQSWSQSFGVSPNASSIGQYFDKHDMKESSYHLLISHLDLHICDDSHTREPGALKHGMLGGAIQLTFRRMAFDYYPFHRAGDACKHWVRYSEAMETRGQWAQKLVSEFQSKVEKLYEEMDPAFARTPLSPFKKKPDPSLSPHKSPLEKGRVPPTSLPRLRHPPWNRLRSSCVVVRVDDLDVHQVSTAGQQSKKPSTLLSCSRKFFKLPDQVSAIHIEFTEYYFPDNQDFPVPCPNLYVQLNGLMLTLDTASVLWINLFCLDLYRSLEQFKAIYKLENSGKRDEHVDVRLDGFHLKLNIPVERKVADHRDRPQALCICTSEVTVTNTRHAPLCSCQDLQSLFRKFASSEFFHSSYTKFPRCQDSFSLLHTLFLRHAYEVDERPRKHPGFPHLPRKPSASEDLWSMNFTELSLDFEGAESSKGRALSFVDPFPLSIWACLPKRWGQAQISKRQELAASELKIKPSASFSNHSKDEHLSREHGVCQRSKTDQDLKNIYKVPETMDALGEANFEVDDGVDNKELEASADIHVLVSSSVHVKVRLNHYQYLVLLRMKEVLQELQEQLARDTQEVTGSPLDPVSACVGVIFHTAEVALVMNPAPGSVLEPRSLDSDTTSLIESELSPSDSKEGLAAEEKELKSETTPEKGVCSTAEVPEDSGSENTGTSVSLERLPRSASDEALSTAPNSKNIEEKGFVEEAHEAVEALVAERPAETSSHPQSPPALPSSPTSDTQSSGRGNITLSGQAELIPLKNLEVELSSALHITKDATKEALHVTMDFTKEAMSITKDALSLSREKMTSTMQKMLSLPPAKDPVPKAEEGVVTPGGAGSTRTRFFSMKRTASQHSFDTTSVDGSGPEDGLSMDSDGSDGFVMLTDSEPSLDPLSSGHLPQVHNDTCSRTSLMTEDKGGVSPEVNSSTSQSGDPSLQLVSVLVLKMNEVNCGIEARGDDLSVALQVMNVVPEQLNNVGMWQYLRGYLALGDPGIEKPMGGEAGKTQPEVCLRFEVGPDAAVRSPLAVQNGFLHMLVHSYTAELFMSFLTNLGPFLEDEIIPEVIPMEIEVVDAKITLKDDNPQVYPTSPGPIPITLAVDHIVVKRRDDGVFYVTALQGEDSPEQEKPVSVLQEQKALAECVEAAPAPAAHGLQLKEVPELQRELQTMKIALAEANMDKARLLQEIRKYNPLFQL
ncbi:bridge-like lipid transfer protein family member 3A isoform X2 [Pezoporus flaviventris]|uniref:bridge-like lipid transfer protein family member 3A isoform X2 n=1 Tax=Pezoporus flaviventris TaxID=889875 RepID=UPI002AB12994|nr:bridge-like lipid transfer protein family member 3A isoform X2 [Pezoporus flaviventris]